jgi:hypothetical protein
MWSWRRRTDHGHRLLGVHGPLGDRRARASAGQHGADREQQHRSQTVTTAAGLARIRNTSRGLQQAGRLGHIQRTERQADSLADGEPSRDPGQPHIAVRRQP